MKNLLKDFKLHLKALLKTLVKVLVSNPFLLPFKFTIDDPPGETQKSNRLRHGFTRP